MGWFDKAMTESREERDFFAQMRATENAWRAAWAGQRAARMEALAQNRVAQYFAPEGRYAYTFDQHGYAKLTEYTTRVVDEDGSGNVEVKLRIKAATRTL